MVVCLKSWRFALWEQCSLHSSIDTCTSKWNLWRLSDLTMQLAFIADLFDEFEF